MLIRLIGTPRWASFSSHFVQEALLQINVKAEKVEDKIIIAKTDLLEALKNLKYGKKKAADYYEQLPVERLVIEEGEYEAAP